MNGVQPRNSASVFARAIHQAGASEVRLVSLPYETTANHGKDLRDYIQERI